MIKNLKLDTVYKTELGEMTLKEYFKQAILSGATFWRTINENKKNEKSFISLNGKFLEISVTQFKHLKKEYPMNEKGKN